MRSGGGLNCHLSWQHHRTTENRGSLVSRVQHIQRKTFLLMPSTFTARSLPLVCTGSTQMRQPVRDQLHLLLRTASRSAGQQQLSSRSLQQSVWGSLRVRHHQVMTEIVMWLLKPFQVLFQHTLGSKPPNRRSSWKVSSVNFSTQRVIYPKLCFRQSRSVSVSKGNILA
jgi:hypothetical protein